MKEEDSELSEKEKYAVYLDAHRKALECEYSEADKSDRYQFILCVFAISVSIIILFCAGDKSGFCSGSITAGALSLMVSQWSYRLSQRGLEFYRDDLLQVDLTVDQDKQVKYRKMAAQVELANTASFGLCSGALFGLVIRCLIEGNAKCEQ
ncbi:hypothetical protein CA11_58110 [Gimesia maris]|uniref:hypothetical protein n=1 Tax=Gimesia maris TaxID=122 RepID=UPI001189342E|nr:hypothetical protein [Gimesia maris]QDU17960.1 hypothetical protein CA11_58110 [Gimesia maris]